MRLWLIAASVLQTLIWPFPENRAQHKQSAPFLASLVFPFLVFPWFIVVIFLGITPVTGTRLDRISWPTASSVVHHPIRVLLLACWAARVAVVLAVFSVVIVPATALIVLGGANRPASADVITWYGAISTFVARRFGVDVPGIPRLLCRGALVRRPLPAAIVLIFVWFPLTLEPCTSISLEEFSLLNLNQSIPTLLRTPWNEPAGGNGCRDSGCGRTGRRGPGRSVPQCPVRKYVPRPRSRIPSSSHEAATTIFP